MGKINQAAAAKTAGKAQSNKPQLKSIEKVNKSKLPTINKANAPANRVKKIKHNNPNATEEEKNKLTAKPTKSEIVVALNALFQLLEKNAGDNKELFKDETKIQLQLTNIKIPKCPTRTVRIRIPHSILQKTSEVCLFVADLQRGKNVDSAPTVTHYEDLLKSKGVVKIPKIIPLHTLKTEFNQFELKRRLLSMYDHFLVDGRISGHVFHQLGSVFQKRNKTAFPVRLEPEHLKNELEASLCKTTLGLGSAGNTANIEIGNTNMTKEDIADNVLAVIEWLPENYPGGWDNIRNLLLKTARSMSIPIYWSLKNKNEVNIPVILSKKRKNETSVEGDLSTIRGSKVKVSSDGTVTVLKKESKKESDGDLSVDESEEDVDSEDETPVEEKIASNAQGSPKSPKNTLNKNATKRQNKKNRENKIATAIKEEVKNQVSPKAGKNAKQTGASPSPKPNNANNKKGGKRAGKNARQTGASPSPKPNNANKKKGVKRLQ